VAVRNSATSALVVLAVDVKGAAHTHIHTHTHTHTRARARGSARPRRGVPVAACACEGLGASIYQLDLGFPPGMVGPRRSPRCRKLFGLQKTTAWRRILVLVKLDPGWNRRGPSPGTRIPPSRAQEPYASWAWRGAAPFGQAGRAANKRAHSPETQLPATATTTMNNKSTIDMVVVYSIRALPERSRNRRNSISVSGGRLGATRFYSRASRITITGAVGFRVACCS
jgi:hypothetical protein